MSNHRELDLARAEAQGRYNKAQEREAAAPHGSRERDAAKADAVQAADDIAKVDAKILQLNREGRL